MIRVVTSLEIVNLVAKKTGFEEKFYREDTDTWVTDIDFASPIESVQRQQALERVHGAYVVKAYIKVVKETIVERLESK